MIVIPAGRTLVNDNSLTVTSLAVLSMVKVSVVVAPADTVAGENEALNVGVPAWLTLAAENKTNDMIAYTRSPPNQYILHLPHFEIIRWA